MPRCDASNPATPTPLHSTIKLQVRFKPASVTISAEPDNPKAGSKAILVRTILPFQYSVAANYFVLKFDQRIATIRNTLKSWRLIGSGRLKVKSPDSMYDSNGWAKHALI